MLLILGAIVVTATSAIGGQVLLVQRQTRLQNTITQQRATICDLAADLHDQAAEIRPVLVPSYRYLHLPAPPPVRPLPKDCR